MGKYKLFFKKSVNKDFRSIPKNDAAIILKRIESLIINPRPTGYEKLLGTDKYRIWQGKYRIIYEIKDDELIIIVVKVGHRRDVYK